MEFKEDRLDEALWTAVEHLDELIQPHTALVDRRGGGKETDSCSGPAARIQRALRHCDALRRLIRTEGPAPLDGIPKGDAP